MTAQTFSYRAAEDVETEYRTPIDLARARAFKRGERFRMVVLAPSIGDVVAAAGGWLFDRSTAGWDVTVAAADIGDDSVVAILGCQTLDVEYISGMSDQGAQPHAIAVAERLLNSDARLGAALMQYIESGAMEVSVFGSTRPDALGGRVGLAAHRLSNAARVFKRHALNAAGIDIAEVAPTEVLYTSKLLWCAPPARDLVRVG
jgi:hypothetical protein